VRFRKLATIVGIAAVAALAVTGLSACRTNVGSAAVIGGHHISDTDITKYLTPQAKPFQVAGQSTGGSQTIVPRSYVLQTLILGRLFEQALADTKGGLPSEGELSAADQQVTQGATKEQEEAQYTKYGFKAPFAKLDVRNSTYEAILAQRLGATQDAGPILKEIKKLNIPVSVSGRYGTWDSSTLSLSDEPTAGLPSFVRFVGPSTQTAQASS
jgi:hypothetical protein